MSISRTTEGDSHRSLLVEIQIGIYVHESYDLVPPDLYLSKSPLSNFIKLSFDWSRGITREKIISLQVSKLRGSPTTPRSKYIPGTA